MKINIVLFQPEIPQNAGNIMRTCVAANARLHLIKPYGFDLSLSSKLFKRNSTNYSNEVEIFEYENFDEFKSNKNESNFYFLTRYSSNIYTDIKLENSMEEIYYVFGNESRGIDKCILETYSKQTFRIPMFNTMRSLNLSNCVALVVYEGLRQTNFENLSLTEPHKINYLGEESGE